MDVLLVFAWIVTALAFLLCLIASSYFIHVRGARSIDVLSKFLLGFIVYGTLTYAFGFLAGMVLFIGAHADPPGSILSTGQLLIGVVLIVVYAACGWLTCSFIVGHLILRNRT